jgi:hypothetical protein
MWPHGVRVAFVGGKKHMGHVYADSGSCSCPGSLFGSGSGLGFEGLEDLAGLEGTVEADDGFELEGSDTCSILTGWRILARLGLLTGGGYSWSLSETS